MSLLDDAMDACVLLDKKSLPDGEGGFTGTWSEGAAFNAAIVFSTSLQARVAQKQGVTSLYTVSTRRSVRLDYHDIFKRLSDGKIFRVTSDGDDVASPASSLLDIRQVTAEEWSLI